MFKNFLKVSIRNLIRNKTYSIINILGLSIGMACSILITLFIWDELSYDQYHKNADNIYRVGIEGNFGGNEIKAYVTGSPTGPAYVDEIPEVISNVRVIKTMFTSSEMLVKYEDKKFIEENMFYVDSTFFEIFDANFIRGNPNECLNIPNQIVITESISNKYFGSVEAIGKSLEILGDEFIIAGVVEDCPMNSHFRYSILISMASTEYGNYKTWLGNDMSYTYILLKKGADFTKVSEKVQEISLKNVEKDLIEFFGADLETFHNSGNYFKYLLQPITEIHLHSHTDFEIEANSDIKYVYIFSVIALFILIVACINFMNLSTARSAKRAKEVGVRKVVGAGRPALFRQFLFESIVLSLISLVIAMIIIESILPLFNNFISKDLNVGYSENVFVIPLLILLAIVVGLFSGIYSAGYLSSIKVLSVLKGSFFTGKNHSWFRNILVIFQFTVSIVLFISTFIIYSQLVYIKGKDIGFKKENILVVNKANYLRDSYQAFKQDLESNSIISSVTYSNTLPGKLFGGFPVMVLRGESHDSYVPRMMGVDYDFEETYKLKVKEGRFFSEEFSADSFSVVLNESAVKEFGFVESAVGQKLLTTFGKKEIFWEVVGVVENFNFRSLHQNIGSLIILPNKQQLELVSIKFNKDLDNEAIKLIKEIWEEFVLDTPFDYSIMEDDFIQMHNQEFKTGGIFALFSILAIFIACLGLLGLASFMVEQKTKEIGIRKAMGASILNIIRLLLKRFSIWVLIANIIAWPLAYYLMNKWLQNFAYHTNVKLWIFPASAALALFIAIFTVVFQAVNAANKNPVDSLRYE